MSSAKSVFITGASSGIGEALARELARRGYRLALVARSHERLEKLRQELGGDTHIQTLDITDTASIGPALDAARRALRHIDIVVANAGIGRIRAVGTGDFQDDLDTFATNISGACATLDAGLRMMREQGHGHLVAISSVSRYRGLPGSAAYGASKAALHLYMQSLRAETWNEGIHVTELAPGFIDTPMNRGAKSRPFVIPVEKGARLMADLIGRRRAYSTVPAWPWALVANTLRLLPTAVIARGTR
jgi:short-subunit dehydrogenase